eukprot:525578_1
MIVKAPSDPSSITTVTAYADFTDSQATIYSLYGNVEFNCTGGCTTLDMFHIIYGMDMSHSCQVSDQQCMNGLQSINQAMNALDIQIEYVDNVQNYNQLNFSDAINHLVVFVLQTDIVNGQTLYTPQIPSAHVRCVKGCSSGTFNFSLTQNASFWADTASSTSLSNTSHMIILNVYYTLIRSTPYSMVRICVMNPHIALPMKVSWSFYALLAYLDTPLKV